jgi:hypothetical protein
MKIAVCFAKDFNGKDVVEKMALSQKLCPEQSYGSFIVPGGALGYITTGERFSSIPLIREGANGNLLLVTGVPIDLHGSVDSRLGEVAAGDYRQAAKSLRCLDGAFAAVFWDAQNQKLVVVTDTLGIQPLYILHREGVLLLATETKAFPASGLINVEMNPAGWGSFVSLGFVIGDQTQMADVKRVDPASVLVYDPTSGSIESTTYWSWPEPEPQMKLEDVDIAEMLRITQSEFDSYASHCRTGTVLLSGGFDSRLILTLMNRAQLDYSALSLTHPEQSFGADGYFARKIARKLNCDNIKRIVPAQEYYSSPSYLKFLVMNEVAIPSMNLYVTPHVAENISHEMKSVWEGLGPGFAFAPAYPNPGGFETYLPDRCKEKDSLHWQATLNVFSDSVGQAMYENFRQLLQQEMDKYSNDDFGVARFQMASQMRRGLSVSPLAVYANRVLTFTPCLSKDLWNIAARIPHNVTSDHKLYFRLFQQFLPEAITVPVCSGEKLLSPRAFTPGLWSWMWLARMHAQYRYYWRRLPKAPVVGPILTKMGLNPQARKWSNELLDAVIRHISPDHPDLDADIVGALQQEEPPYSWPTRLSRRMLFNWQMWRWIMEGRLTTRNADTFLEQELP